MAGGEDPGKQQGHLSPKILEILIIQNGGKVAAGKETSPRQQRKMADKTDVSSVRTSDQEFLTTFQFARNQK